MGLGQTLIALLAIVLMMTMIVNINKAVISATADTVESQYQLEALNFAQSVVEGIRGGISSSADFADLYTNFHGIEETGSFDTAYDLFATVVVDTTETLELHDVRYKKVTVTVFRDQNKSRIISEYTASFSDIYQD